MADLLLHQQLGAGQAAEILCSLGFADGRAAWRSLKRLAPALACCLPDLLRALAGSANPDRALVNLERLAESAGDPSALFLHLAGDLRALAILVTLFAGSQFLTEIVLRNPQDWQRLCERRSFGRAKDPEQFAAEAQAAMAPFAAAEDRLAALRRYQRGELLRIGAGDLLGLADLPTVATQLSHLADSVVRACLAVVAESLGMTGDGFAVLALGKLGGEELNYSSDIDLLFLARANASAYLRLGERLIEALARVTAEGFLYRVDMRLRPWGEDGALVISLPAYLAYLRQHARLWEKQALLKTRVIAGDMALGGEFLRQAEPLLFASPPEAVRADVRRMKRRIEAELERRGREWGEVKLGKGSLRDVEFVAQHLQLVHGGRRPEVRSRNTLDALGRLAAAGLLPAAEYRVLAEGYTFLRPVEHYLQLVDYRQTHALPSGAKELASLARRLGFQGAEAGAQFLARYQQHCAAIRAVYQRHLEDDAMSESGDRQPPAADLHRHLARMAPSYAATFDEQEIRRHVELAERLGEDNLVEVDATPLPDGDWRVTVVGYDYPGELSLICGLLFVYGFTIRNGHVFTYEPLAASPSGPAAGPAGPRAEGPWRPKAAAEDTRRKIVDVFNVHSVIGPVAADLWSRYASDLTAYLHRLRAKEQREVQGQLAKRVAVALHEIARATATLHPIDIEIDNDADERYTVLRIDTPDTIGFLYEFTSALALSGIYIARVTVDSIGSRAHDILYLTDASGQKITAPQRQRELRAATVLVKHFTHLLPLSPNPESALLHFADFLGQLFQRPDWPAALASLERPEVLNALARLLGVSDFLWEDFLRMQHANLFPVVRDVDALATARARAQLEAELHSALEAAPDGPSRRSALNAFKDREMFRVDMRHIQGHVSVFGQFSAELTDLAEVVVEAAYRLCDGELRSQFGEPRLEDGRPCPLSLCALGKLAGRELGFASDIELMFVYGGSGKTGGPEVITTAEYYNRLVTEVTGAIQARREGIFHIDLQLRPHGSAGSLAVSLESFRRYYAPGGAAWSYERQALVKMRPIAGDAALGQELLRLRDEFVYGGEPFDAGAMRAMRERQVRHLVSGGTINAKYSPGGLVDVEYLVQALEINHGHRNTALRLANTREAIGALAAAGVLSREDYARLREAYIFLRQLIDALRMVRGNAKDLTVPPADGEEFAFLARRLGYAGDTARLRDDLTRYTASVQELLARLLA